MLVISILTAFTVLFYEKNQKPKAKSNIHFLSSSNRNNLDSFSGNTYENKIPET